MKNLFCLFFTTFNIIYLINSTQDDRCLTFESLKYHPNNSCSSWTSSTLIEKTMQTRSCFVCDIKDINIIVAKTCRRRFTCISFLFDNNTFFEEFFQQNPHIIYYLQNDSQNKQIRTTLMITIVNYNLTEITFNYLNSLLHMNLSPYDVLQIKFIKPISNMKSINIKEDFSNVPIELIYLIFSCNYRLNDHEWIQYTIKPESRKLERSGICQESHTSTKTIFHNTTINIRSHFSFIQLLQKYKHILFYAFIPCLILVTGAIVIPLCKHLQRYHQSIGARSSVTSIDTSDTAITNEKSVDSSLLDSRRLSSSSNKYTNSDKRTVDSNKRDIHTDF